MRVVRVFVMQGCALVALGVMASAAQAQDDARIVGRVVHHNGNAPIAGAEVHLAPGAHRVLSDSSGAFRFAGLPAGTVTISVRLLGFAPESASFDLAPREDVDVLVELRPLAQPLDTVAIRGNEETLMRGKLAGYADRKRMGFGRFIDGRTLEEQGDRALSEILANSAAGLRMIRAHYGGSAWLATGRRWGTSLQAESSVNDIDRRRGADPLACYADVYLDGVLVYAFGRKPPQPLFDLNGVLTQSVVAIEWYAGRSRTPLSFLRSNAECGVLLIWTR